MLYHGNAFDNNVKYSKDIQQVNLHLLLFIEQRSKIYLYFERDGYDAFIKK